MNVYESIEKRRSVRMYKDKPVPEKVLTRIMNAARLSPSANNMQSRRFIIVTDREIRKNLAVAANEQYFIAGAPVVIAAVGLNPEKIMSCGIPSDHIDVAIAIDHITLAAVEEGLGTCWIGAFSQEKVCKILNVPSQYKIVELLTLGYPADAPGTKDRKKLKEIICYQHFS